VTLDVCAPDTYCDSPDGTTGTCVAMPATGEPCLDSIFIGSGSCASDLYCKSGTCTAKPILGERCSSAIAIGVAPGNGVDCAAHQGDCLYGLNRCVDITGVPPALASCAF
jgi:hypothetical protein